MTKGDDFKRIVRRQARERGERYTEAKARLQEDPPANHEDGWVILRTVPGTEEQVQRWLMPRQALGVAEVLVPRFKERKFAPGLLLVRIEAGADISALVAQSWVTGFVGTVAPAVMSWDAVRRELVTQSPPKPRPRDLWQESRARSDRPVPAAFPEAAEVLERNSVPPRPGLAAYELDERREDVAAFDVLAAAARAESALTAEASRLTSARRQMLLDQLELGIRARRQLLDSYGYLVEAIVSEFEDAERPTSQLLEAGMAELNETIGYFVRSLHSAPPLTRTLNFLVFATKTIREVISQLVMNRGA
jgi:transcription antitermination factor NusG